MELRRFIFGVIASMAIFAACEQEEQNLGTPNLTLSVTEMTFDEAGGNQTLTLNATRDWMVETNADWVVVNPESGSASADDQTVTVTVLENSGMDREVDLKFTIGMKSKYLTVSQAGPGGSAEALVVYYNDYDKVEAEKTYGSGSSWPYLDQFDGWMNETGTGAANVEYSYSGMSARANSTSNSNYSDYPGSGKNNMFFGKSAYLATKNIALGGATDFTLTFGTEKYSQDNGSVFTKSEYHIFVSNDAAKWVEITDYTFAGEGTEGRWNIATADFSVPAGTENLSICIKVDVASSYRMDDFKLVISDGGATVDFSKGVEMDFTAGGSTGGGSTTAPESKGKKTVEEFIAAADNSNYYELTGKVSGFNPTYCSFDLTDDSGKIYVYSVLDASKAEWTDKISNGGTITIYGKYLYYEQKSQHEVVDAYIVSFKADGSGSTGGNESEKPESLIKATVADFLAAPESSDTWYELTGEITSIVSGNAYGNLHINDGTGEVYIYGLTNGWVGYNDKSFNSIGLKVGDTVTLGTLRGSYNGEPQGGGSKVPAYYISHVPGEGGSTGGGDVSDASWSYTFAEGDLGSTGSLLENVTLNGVTWTFVMNDADFLGYDSQNGRGLQMGKKADPASSISLSTDGISGTIKKMVINTSGASGTDATLVVKVGGSEFGSPVKTTNSAADYVFEGSASGKIELNWTLSAAAVYIKSIAVYTE
ncbi:MAG: BACON domain-containing protein [Bacteroidales bacterium]|nr:BACON domain-containing protein [Bacteroidales bacterium]